MWTDFSDSLTVTFVDELPQICYLTKVDYSKESDAKSFIYNIRLHELIYNKTTCVPLVCRQHK